MTEVESTGRAPRRRRVDSIAAESAFRQRIGALGGTVLEPEWLGAQKPHRVRCAAGHECLPRPANIHSGWGFCKICAGQDPATTEKAFRARLAELGATLLEPYRNSKTPIRARCAAGHDCSPMPNSVQQGQGICPACTDRGRAAAEAAFRARLTELGAELLEPYRGSPYPHQARCAAGHECSPRPDWVQQGGGICTFCSRQDPAESTESVFRARLAELGAILLEPAWLGGKHPHRIRCAAGHECSPRPGNIKRGQGICRVCTGRVWDAFYVVIAEQTERLKFGVTSGDSRPRLRTHRVAGYDVVARLLIDLPGSVALDLERATRATLRLAKVEPARGREYYSLDALPVVLDVVDNYLLAGLLG